MERMLCEATISWRDERPDARQRARPLAEPLRCLANPMMTIPEFLTAAPRHLFFTGKGGVGKTSLACASAVVLADKGRRVLLVSTDPASNLDAVLGAKLANQPTPVTGVGNLCAMNIDPEQAARDYRERTLAPYRGIAPPDKLKLLEERLSGACTIEVASFDEFALLLTDSDKTGEFDHVIFDTAPTGHTLRLLELPAAWTGFLESAPGEVSCLGPLSGLKTAHERYARAVAALADGKLTATVVVARPDRVALLEAARTSRELHGQSMDNQLLAINGVFHATDRSDPLATAFERRQARALAQIPEELAGLPRADVPLLGINIVGFDALRSLFARPQRADASPAGADRPAARRRIAGGPRRGARAVRARPRHGHGQGRGRQDDGRGRRGHRSLAKRGIAGAPHDDRSGPAHHGRRCSPRSPACGSATSIPKQEARRYRDACWIRRARDLSAEKLALFNEELKSPCYEEVAVFQAFSRIVIVVARKGFVVRRYGADRPYAAAARHRRRLPPPDDAAGRRGSAAHSHAAHAAAGSGTHEGSDRRLAGNDAGARSKRPTG